MLLNASMAGAISTNRVGGMRTEKSPPPSRAALWASALTGRRPRLTMTWVIKRSAASRRPVMATVERVSIHSSASSGAEAGVTARIA